MLRKADPSLAARDEQREEAGQVWKVAGERDISRFAAQTIANPLRRIVRLQIA